MDPSVDWNAFKVWGSVSLLVAIVVLIGVLIWCWCWCCRCCCDSCGCCSSGNCADDCHCSCCSRVKKENVTRATSNEGLELGGPANGGNNQFEDVIVTVSGQVHHHSLTTGQPKYSLSYEDETNDRRVSFEPAVAPRYDQEPESPDDVTPGEKDSVCSHNIHKEINDGHDNKGYEADDGGDDDDDDNIHHPGDRPTSDIGTSYRNHSDTIIPVDVDGYNSRDDSKSSIGSDVGGQQARLQAIKDCVDDENTKDSEERNHKSTAGVGLDDIKSNFTFANLNAILGQWFPSHNDDVDNSTRQYIDDSEGNSIESSSSSEEEIDGFVVGEKLMERHVVMAREIPLDMSTEEKEDFAYRKASGSYHLHIPPKYTLILVENINDFRRKVLKNSIPKALDCFTTTESFDVVYFIRRNDTEYRFVRSGQARLELSCNPEKVVSHLAGVVFS